MSAFDQSGPTRAELTQEADDLESIAARSVLGGSVWWLTDDLVPDPSHGRHLWITARMSHVLSTASLRVGGSYAESRGVALASIDGDFRDDEHGGWFPALDVNAEPVRRKTAYEHAFVLLAASSAVIAAQAGATSLLRRAIAVVDQYFWDESLGVVRESYDDQWRECEPYIGANANMHTVEAFIAVADATGNDAWIERALRVAKCFADKAAAHRWRLPEHYSPDLTPDLAYNDGEPNHPFRPPGATPGHAVEWARLLTQLWARTDRPAWALDAARNLFAVALGGAVDGAALYYTTSFDGRSKVRAHFHWVQCEAIFAAEVLAQATGDQQYVEARERLWTYTWNNFRDQWRGGWYHELDESNQPAHTTWVGKPDTYHAYQACLSPTLGIDRSVAASMRSV